MKTKKSVILISERVFLSIISLLLTLYVSYLFYINYLFHLINEIFNLNRNYSFGNLFIPIFSYILFGLNICLAVNIFKKIKKYEEEGIVNHLVSYFIASLIAGFIMGLLAGIVFGFVGGIIVGISFSFILSAIYVIIIGLMSEII